MTTSYHGQLDAALGPTYRVEKQLGEGGMATVYLARDLKHERQVAIKVLRPELAAVIGAERFVREIRTIAALQHPHILGLIDSGEVQGTAYYVMPFVEGESLRDRLVREKQLPIADAVRIATEVAAALDYAHRHGVIHRDIKPENILLHDGQALVADFGIALAVSSAGGTRMTETGMSLGTPHYMSPEQAMGEREITARSDVYALGCVTYEMLTGDPPFTGSTAQAIVAKVMTDEPAPPRRHRKAVPEAVEAAVLRALEKLPADRFATAAEFAEGLTATSPPARAAAAARGRPWLADRRTWLLLAVATAALAAAVSLPILHRRSAGEVTHMSVAQNTFRQEAIFTARWAEDGKTIIYSAASRGSNPRLYIVRPDYPEPQAFGPDSTHLLAVSSKGELALLTHATNLGHRVFTGTLARMALGGGAPREIMENVQEADWSPDGGALAITRASGDRDRLEYPAGRVLYESRPGGYLSDPRVSPRGDRIALFDHSLRGDDRGLVVAVDTSGKSHVLTAEFWGLEGLAWAGDGAVLFSGADRGGAYQVHRAEMGAGSRLVLPSPGTLTMQDVSADGRWLVSRDDQPLRLFARPSPSAGMVDLSWLDNSLSPRLSADGQLMAFTDQSIAAGPQYAVMLRKTDGSPVVRLGQGAVGPVSRDKRWVIGVLPTAPRQYVLYPAGAGEPRRLSWTRLETINSVDFFPDSRSLFICGNERGKASRCYRSPLDASSLEPVTPDSIRAGLLRPDGRGVLVRRLGGLWVFPLGAGSPRPVPGLGDTVAVRRWSPDGKALWVQTGAELSPRVDRVDVETGRRSALVTIEPPAGVPLFQIFGLSLADDPRVYAYSAWSYSSELFTVEGVQ